LISAIIIDDESKGRLALREKLRLYCPEIELLAEAKDGPEGIQLIQAHQPQLIFLDIEMPKMNGFDMLNHIDVKSFHIIFTTAYDQYAIKAIKYAAFDYLLKPINIQELRDSINKLSNTISTDSFKQVELLHHNLQHPKRFFNKIAIPSMDGLGFYDIDDIVRLEADSNYTTLYFFNQTKVLASKQLKDFEELLPPEMFFRTHHAHIVNLKYIKRYIKGEGGKIELLSGDTIEVSRRKKADFLKTIGYA
jgi:two-component system, LytTR family, response regulator